MEHYKLIIFQEKHKFCITSKRKDSFNIIQNSDGSAIVEFYKFGIFYCFNYWHLIRPGKVLKIFPQGIWKIS